MGTSITGRGAGQREKATPLGKQRVNLSELSPCHRSGSCGGDSGENEFGEVLSGEGGREAEGGGGKLSTGVVSARGRLQSDTPGGAGPP